MHHISRLRTKSYCYHSTQMIMFKKIAVRALPKVCASSFSTQGAGIPRLRVVMDLDDCMVSMADKEIEGLTFKSLEIEFEGEINLHIRPGLPEYLRELTELADVFAFTAGMPHYARPVINCLDPEQKIFKNVWYRDSCTEVLGFLEYYTKDLTVLGDQFDSNRTVLVDNNMYSFVPQPSNGILVPDFYNDPKDDALSEVLNVVKSLQTESDVKPILHDMFNLTALIEEALHKNQIAEDRWKKR